MSIKPAEIIEPAEIIVKATVNPEMKEWVAEQAAQWEVSEAWVVRRALREARDRQELSEKEAEL